MRGRTHGEAPLICLLIVVLSKIAADTAFLQFRLRGNTLCEAGGRQGSELSFTLGLLVGSE